MSINKDAESIEQKFFDSAYITVGEICDTYHVTRSSIKHARETGKLPGAVAVGVQFIWRRDFIEPHIAQWMEQRYAR